MGERARIGCVRTGGVCDRFGVRGENGLGGDVLKRLLEE